MEKETEDIFSTISAKEPIVEDVFVSTPTEEPIIQDIFLSTTEPEPTVKPEICTRCYGEVPVDYVRETELATEYKCPVCGENICVDKKW
jgi:predicted RNA-binding Zn-ribbon protein involved in translation (DUF1610 family)